MNKKYILLNDETINHNGCTLYRIQAVRDFTNVKKGSLGGYIEKESNLSQNGNCWVYDSALVFNNAYVSDNASVLGNAQIYNNARVYGNAKVFGNAQVSDNAQVFDSACVFNNAFVSNNTRVYDNAYVYGNARVWDNAWVYHDAKVYGNARVYGNAHVYGNACVYGDAHVYGNTLVCDNAEVGSDVKIDKTENLIVIGPIGSRNSFTTFAKSDDGGIYVTCGCFFGTIDAFKKKVLKTHDKDSIHRKKYLSIIKATKYFF